MRASRHSALRRTTAAAGGLVLAAAVAGCNQTTGGGAAGQAFPSDTIEIMVPAGAGGGWDSTARTMQEVVQNEDLVDESVEVFNVEGGGGATGLAQLQEDSGNPHALMMTGLVMLGALELADSEVSLDNTTPIAVLTSEAEAFVVPAKSPFKTINDVIDAYVKDPSSVTFGGGSAGGSDQLVAAELVQEAGGDASEMEYIGYSGGGEAIAGILSGDVEVGVSGISEFTEQIKGGKMRLLAVSTADPVEVNGEQAPTLQDAGYDVDFANWRGIVAAPGLSDEQRDQVVEVIDELHGTDAWKQALADNNWTDFFKTGDEAEKFIKDEAEKTKQIYEELGL
ncbi:MULTISPECIES: Bug family tripartite tricarboxylate transporter substrate binding protein [Nocardioides]|uniref:Bug family tripartite tricarboxylate transporter substrate binding protein n=1 Tax=Nocardioides vastitatis TaxID=2568655 RepID=A0ABW0ZI25_9ACTN|nr:tripartite tricarboxylate transporter substrate-binding protein [Nocardioides sp.]THJ09211.1 tripartite tricarboxylate transporter substrate binding protein [Nocardioides sp.]